MLYSVLAADGVRITTAIQSLIDGAVRTIPLPDGTANLGPGAWSPDGERLALQLWDESNPSRNGVYTVMADNGSDLIRITDPDVADIPGDYSPDGSQIVIFREGPTQSVGELFIVGASAGGEPTRISPEGMEVGYGSVRFSPDGTRILFQDSRTSARGALWTAAPDGNEVTMIFEDDEGRFASHPTWSPDGSMIMFALNPVADDFEHRPNGLYVMYADGSNIHLVIGGNDFKREPEWRIP